MAVLISVTAVPRLKYSTSEFISSSVTAEPKGTETMWNEKENSSIYFFIKHLVTCFHSRGKEMNAGARQVLVIPGTVDMDTIPKRYVRRMAQKKEFTGEKTGLPPSFSCPSEWLSAALITAHENQSCAYC